MTAFTWYFNPLTVFFATLVAGVLAVVIIWSDDQ